MSDQRRFSFTIEMNAPAVDCAMQALALIADHRKKSPDMFDLPEDMLLPMELADAVRRGPVGTAPFVEALFNHLRGDPEEAEYLAAISWDMRQNQGEIGCGMARLHIYSETGGWVELEPAVAIIRACQEEFRVGRVGFKYHQELGGELDAGTVVVRPGQPAEYFCLSQYLEDRLKPPAPAPGTGVAPSPA